MPGDLWKIHHLLAKACGYLHCHNPSVIWKKDLINCPNDTVFLFLEHGATKLGPLHSQEIIYMLQGEILLYLILSHKTLSILLLYYISIQEQNTPLPKYNSKIN